MNRVPWFDRCPTAACLAVLLASRLFAADTLPAVEQAAVEIPDPAHVTLMLVRDPEVKEELKLKLKQAVAVDVAVAKVDQSLWRLRDVSPAVCGQELNTHLATLRSDLGKTLKEQQLARLDQLVMQARGPRAIVAPDLRDRLQLNDTQVAQLTKLTQRASDGKFDARQVMSVLGAEQQHQLQIVFGPRFDLSKVSRIGCIAPELREVPTWINSDPLTLKKQRGKVVVVHFWAFGCINCVRNLPHYQSWYEAFPKSRFTIIGIQTPETEAERDVSQLRANIAERGIAYPVAFDANAENWQAWANRVWPAVYLIDKRGQVRSWWYGELNWQGATGEQQFRKQIAKLLAE